MTLQEYSGRTYDVLAYQDAVAAGEVLVKQQLIGDDNQGQICTGIQKLAQKFLLILLTEKGTKVHFPDFGTEFITDAKRGFFQTPLDVFASFSAAIVDIKTQLQAEETADDPDDEIYAEAEIVSVSLAGLTVAVTVELRSAAGTSVRFIPPLNITV